ncbi:hypothetical protein [Parasegetibacter sp. NRK P23]|uniref:hypothetical protein n=1 Tax=Parasegetibacter sp. NRK P23 TaxID=2942999 RepID=UPI002044CDAC|nr:hypothetical protein [Parasegetibacter sp. NRK P23]MCM5529277.1 hypothetical protein [Parasegetibacter sp. NRK P23]
MSINNIHLVPQQMAQFYRRGLVIIPEKTMESPSLNVAPPVKILGNFSRKILILVRYPNEVHLPEEQLNFLTNILQACKLSLDEVGILNIAQHTGLTYTRIMSELSPACQLWLGITSPAIEAPFRLEELELQTIDQIQFISSPPLEAMNQQSDTAKSIKGRLWLNLKIMFQL